MVENDIIESYFEEEYGIHVQRVIDVYPLTKYIKIKDESITRINSLLRDLPFLAVQLSAEQKAAGAYKVIFDKGLGVLQQSANNSERLRANVVEFGTNNKIVGQAEIESLHLKVTSPALAIFEVASIITNQYYLARIDKELSSLHKELKNVTRLLENSKESELRSHERALQSVSDNLSVILRSEDYRKSTLINVQDIRMSDMSLVEYYHRERLNVLEAWSKEKGRKDSYIQEFLSNYKNKLDLYNRAFQIYALAYILELMLSQITDTDSILRIANEIETVVCEYTQEYDMYFERFNNQTVKNYRNTLMESGAHMIGGAATGFAAGLVGISTFPIAAFVVGGVWAGNTIKDKKAEKILEKFKGDLQKIEEGNIYNIRLAEKSIMALTNLNKLYNDKVVLLIKDDAVYMKVQ